jgi:hypothetical protein
VRKNGDLDKYQFRVMCSEIQGNCGSRPCDDWLQTVPLSSYTALQERLMQLPYGQSPACECRSTTIPSNPSNLSELWSYHGAVAGLESGLDLLRFSTALRGASTQGNLGCSTKPIRRMLSRPRDQRQSDGCILPQTP